MSTTLATARKLKRAPSIRPIEEVAAEVGMSVSGVRKRLDKLRTKLRHLEDRS